MYPFEHKAAEEVRRIFLSLDVRCEEDYWKMCRRDRIIWDVSWFETEVMNGGMEQYLCNTSGDHALECLCALHDIKAYHSYRALKAAVELFPNHRPSADRACRLRELAVIRAKHGVETIDDVISGQLDDNLYQLLLDYYQYFPTSPRGRSWW